MSTTPEGPSRPERAEPLSAREGRRPLGVPHEGVPPHLERQLRVWLSGFLTVPLERRVALQLEIELMPREFYADSSGPPQELYRHPQVDLLDAADVALQLDAELSEQARRIRHAKANGYRPPKGDRADLAAGLARLLDDANSVYRLGRGPGESMCLLRRVDPTVQAAAEEAIAAAEPTSGDLLRQAWVGVYSREPDPDSAYLDAVRAVETLAGPLVLPKSTRATLSSITKHLRDAPQKWELTLTKLGDGSIEPVIEMFDRLWHGNLASRHGSLGYREVTLDEARAAVHLAVTLVQWLTDGVLRPRAIPGIP